MQPLSQADTPPYVFVAIADKRLRDPDSGALIATVDRVVTGGLCDGTRFERLPNESPDEMCMRIAAATANTRRQAGSVAVIVGVYSERADIPASESTPDARAETGAARD